MHCATFFNFCLKKFRYIFNHFYTRLGREKFKNYVTFRGILDPLPRCHTLSHLTDYSTPYKYYVTLKPTHLQSMQQM